MNEMNELSQVFELWSALSPLDHMEQKNYLAAHPELPANVIEQALILLRDDDGDSQLPPVDALLDELERLIPCKSHEADTPEKK